MSHLYARLHAFLHSFGRPSEADLTREVHDAVIDLMHRHRLTDPEGRRILAQRIANDGLDRLGDATQLDPDNLFDLITAILDYDEMFQVPHIDWHERRSVSDVWELRDRLKVQKALLENFDRVVETLSVALFRTLTPFCDAALRHQASSRNEGITIATKRLDLLADLGRLIEAVAAPWFDDEIERLELLPRLRGRIDRNLIAASGGNPDDPRGLTRAPKMPSKSDITDRRDLVGTYLGGTPLISLFSGSVDFTIPTPTRFEHHHIVGGSGHGKTQTLQYLIGHDLEAIARGNASVIVLDSQGDLIKMISQLQIFAPDAPLHDRICIIDPTDVEYPVSLNLFDVGIERLQSYPMLERERLTNSILELYDFVLGSLLDAGMTQKQSVIFRYVTRLMLHIPDATIHTLRRLMEPGSEAVFAKEIAGLTGTARQFFETEFASKEFEQTKKQVLRRLWGILENQTFERMFSHPRSKLDLFSEMNAGKVILINTAKDLLKETGTEIFGRFFIAMIAQAAQERSVLAERDRLPTFVYIDEAADYFDRNIGLILSQARKFNVGMILAHQYLGQLDPKLQEAFGANTAIKFAGGVSNRDARSLAPMLGCSPEFIEQQPKGAFAASVRGLTTTALPLRFPFGSMEDRPRMSRDARKALQETMREKYAVHYSELFDGPPAKNHEAARAMDPNSGEDTEVARQKGEPRKDPDHPDTDASPQW